MALAVGWAGCGLTAIGSHEEEAPVPEAEVDAPGASLTETSVIDTALPPVPEAASSEIPIGDLDAGTDANADLDAGPDGATVDPALEIVTSGGGKFHMVTPGELLPCSVAGGNATLVVRNLGAEKIDVRWVNYSCYEVGYGTLGTNKQVAIGTYAGNRWRIRSDADAGILGDFVLDAPGTYTVTVH